MQYDDDEFSITDFITVQMVDRVSMYSDGIGNYASCIASLRKVAILK
jgi:hypothetical protein